MELKVRLLDWEAGVPSVMLNQKTADKVGIFTKDRVSIRTMNKNPKEVSTTLDTIKGIIRENEIGVSNELKDRLSLRKGQRVDVNLAVPPQSLEQIKKKMEGKELTGSEIHTIIKDVVDNSLSESEIALFVSGMYKHGMNTKETINLIEAILKTGSKLKLRNKYVVDKHSIGGVPGNRTTPIVVSICVAAGLIMPKTSSRAITSAAGTADVIETIARVEYNMKDLKKLIKKTGGCMVWGGYLGMVPADSKIIRVEKSLKIDPMAQLIASIMSKKLAVGSKYIIIDIPYGKEGKVTKNHALELKRKFEELGKYFKVKVKCVLTDGEEPIGRGVGPVLELRDIIKVLDPEKNGPDDLENKSIMLASHLLEMTGKAKKGEGEVLARGILKNGKAFEKFKEIIEAQEGDFSQIKEAKFKRSFVARKSGKVKNLNNKKIGSLARVTGCPLDKSAGLYLHVKKNEKVKKRQKLLTVYANSKTRLNEAIRYYNEERPIVIG